MPDRRRPTTKRTTHEAGRQRTPHPRGALNAGRRDAAPPLPDPARERDRHGGRRARSRRWPRRPRSPSVTPKARSVSWTPTARTAARAVSAATKNAACAACTTAGSSIETVSASTCPRSRRDRRRRAGDELLSDARGRRRVRLSGPKESMPPPPSYEWMRAPRTHLHVSKTLQNSNYLQALGGRS